MSVHKEAVSDIVSKIIMIIKVWQNVNPYSQYPMYVHYEVMLCPRIPTSSPGIHPLLYMVFYIIAIYYMILIMFHAYIHNYEYFTCSWPDIECVYP